MLEVSKSFPSVTPELAFSGPSGSSADYLSVATGILRRNWLIFAIILTITTSLLVAYYLISTPIYRAVATVALDTRKFQLFQQPTSMGEVSIDSSAAVESQVEILKSENIALQVIKKLNLNDAASQPKVSHWR